MISVNFKAWLRFHMWLSTARKRDVSDRITPPAHKMSGISLQLYWKIHRTASSYRELKWSLLIYKFIRVITLALFISPVSYQLILMVVPGHGEVCSSVWGPATLVPSCTPYPFTLRTRNCTNQSFLSNFALQMTPNIFTNSDATN